MKKGFTMIELIFVIVILGILAAVAIPKLAATRDDANVAKAATELSTAINDIGSYYTANGSFGTASEMTNVIFDSSTANQSDGNMTNGEGYNVGTIENCITFTTTVTDGNLTITNNTGATVRTELCEDVQDLIAAKDLNSTHTFGGKKVVW